MAISPLKISIFPVPPYGTVLSRALYALDSSLCLKMLEYMYFCKAYRENCITATLTNCCSTDSGRPHRFIHLSHNFGVRWVFANFTISRKIRPYCHFLCDGFERLHFSCTASLFHPSPHRRRHLDLVACFITAHGCVQQTNGQTDTHRNT